MIIIDERSKINLINYLKGQAKRIEEETYKAVADTANIIKTGAKHDSPVKTGALRASISSRKIRKGEHVVAAKVKYAGYVESYYKKKGTPYWSNNVQRGKNYLNNQIKKIK